MVDKNFFVSAVCEIALLGIPKVCPDVIGYVAGLYVDYLFHGRLRRMPRVCQLENEAISMGMSSKLRVPPYFPPETG